MLGVVDGSSKLCSPRATLPDFEHGKLLRADECQAASVFGHCVFPASLSHKEEETSQVGLGASDDYLRAMRASPPTFGKLEMQTSKACHEGFVIFDHGEGKSRVIVHPSWLNNCPQLGPALQWGFNGSADNHVNKLSIPYIYSTQEAMHGPFSTPACGMAGEELVLQVHKMDAGKKAACTLTGFPKFSQAQNSKKHMNGMGLCLDTNIKEYQEDFHENTEEIDALLSSGYGDEEEDLTSTGHSPSDASSNGHDGSGNYLFDNITGKKRKLQGLMPEEADDADSGPGIAESRPGPESQYHTLLNKGSRLSLYLPNTKTSARNCGTKAPSRNNDGHVATKALARSCAGEHIGRKIAYVARSCGTFEEGGLVDSSKRVKIRSMMQELKHVVPMGCGLDTVGMLGKTIEYVKCLQRRLRDLEATRELSGASSQKA